MCSDRGTAIALAMTLGGFALFAGPVDFPNAEGPEAGPRVLMMHGSRPWRAEEDANLLIKAGARVTNLSSVYMDGFGSSIKRFWSDKIEPEAKNGLDLAFERLGEYDLLLVHEIPNGNIDRIFTSERLAKVRSYVENGGHVLFAMETPSAAGNLVPVRTGVMESMSGRKGKAGCPKGVAYELFGSDIPIRGPYRKAVLNSGAEALSVIHDEDGAEVAPLVARRLIGRGFVTYMNVRIVLPNSITEFVNWAYGRAFFCAVVADSMGKPLDAKTAVDWLDSIPERQEIAETRASVAPPQLGVIEDGAPVVDGTTAVFRNGIRLMTASNGEVSVSWPDCEGLIRRFKIPSIEYSKKARMFDDATAEAVNVKESVDSAAISWTFAGMTTKGNRLVLKYVADGLEMKWAFKSGSLELDGRRYAGLADAVAVVRCPFRMQSVRFVAELTPEDPRFARRFACYTPPRGYDEFDMSGKKDGDTGRWNVLGSGQPFELLVCGHSVYAGTPTAAEPQEIGMKRVQGAEAIESVRVSTLGRVNAPRATEFWWHWFSRGPERAHNDYLAFYQYVRRMLRRKYGLAEFPAVPISAYVPEMDEKARCQIMDYSKDAGYRFIHQPCPESPIEMIASDHRMKDYHLIRERGMGAHIWSAGGYTQALGNPICQKHPEWFIKDEKGNIFQYFNGYPVFDIQNAEFYSWYTNIMTIANDNGVQWVYRDMDGAANLNIDYSKDVYPHCATTLLKYYRFFHDRGMRVGVEGMNPLVLDEYWYRKHLYRPFAGREFALVGSQPNASTPSGVTLDPFRTGMYGCFMWFDHAGATFGVDFQPGSLERARKADMLVPKFTEALDICGMPFIRETEFGTAWTGERGGALFFWNPTRRAVIDLPNGWRIRGIEGNVLTDVAGDSIYFIDKR